MPGVSRWRIIVLLWLVLVLVLVLVSVLVMLLLWMRSDRFDNGACGCFG
jgi:hypothetical protein